MLEPNPFSREVYLFGEYRLDLAARRLTRAEESVALPPKAFELLQLLVRNADRAMSRSELLDAVWRDTIVEEGSLGWNMSVLRRALEDADGRIVETVRGYGYRFAAPVTRAEGPGPAREPSAEPARGDAPAPEPETAEPGARAPARVRRGAIVGVGGVCLLLVALAIVVRARLEAPGASQPAARAGALPALAVLPFENLSGRPEVSWLSTAISEVLTTELELGGAAAIVPGESVARVSAELGQRAGSGLAATTLANLHERLGADLVVVGNYLVVGEPPTLRVDLRLQDVGSGSTRRAWSGSRPAGELLTVVAEAGAELQRALGGPGGGESPAGPSAAYRAPNEALRAYTQGLELRRAFRFRDARARFEEALGLAPDFVVARAALADLLAELGYSREAVEQSRRALAGAGVLSALERLPVEARNRELEGRWVDAAELWSELDRRAPAPLEHALARVHALSRAGRHEEARAALVELARRPAPVGDDPRIELHRGWTERYAQDFLAMEAAGQRAAAHGRRLRSDYVLVEALALVAWADLSLGRNEPGLRACTEGLEVGERIGHARLLTLHSSLCGWLDYERGDAAGAELRFRRSAELAERDGNAIYEAGARLALGWVHAGRGEAAAAGTDGERALELARGVGDLEREVNALELLTAIAISAAELERAERLSVEALAKSRQINISSRVATHLGLLGRVRRLRGDFTAALAAHEEAVRLVPEMAPDRIAARELELAESRLEAGDVTGAVELCDRIERRLAEAAGDAPPGRQRLLAAALRGRAQLARGDREAARRERELLGRHAAALSDDPSDLPARMERARLLAELGETAAAETELGAISAAAVRGGQELFRVLADFRLAELRARSGAPEAAAALARERRLASELRLGQLLGERL